ncbi:MAG: OmpA family protein, partial [Flavobacteriales bacterium]|nr:OmpA family protein [Flavobacteriales bacterium]
MRQLLLPVLLLLHVAAHPATTNEELLVHFAKDRSELTPEAIAALDAFLDRCPLNGEYRFTVHGHTDSDGSLAYNDALSAERADVVLRYLVAHGVPTDLVQVQHSGEQRPLESNAHERGMAVNRRVRITFDRTYYGSVNELRTALTAGTVQRFEIDPGRQTSICGAAGTRIDLAAHAFVDANGRRVSGPVTVELTEALAHQAMIGHRLSTRSEGRMLETGGMMQVLAMNSNGEVLRLAADSPMQISMPSNDPRNGMELFLSPDGSDWTSTAQPMQVQLAPKWVEPRAPMVLDRRFKAPVYVEDRKGMPLKPSPPFLKRPPTRPDRSDFKPRRTFLSFLWPERGEQDAEIRFQRALRTYDQRRVRFDRQQVAFEEEVRSYPSRIERYEERKAAWDAKKEEEHARWIEEVYLPAHARHHANNADRRQLRDSLMAVWREERDARFTEYMAESDRRGTAEMDVVRSYLFTSNRLGWINCDRFFNVPPAEQGVVIAQGQAPIGLEVYLIFTEIASMMRLTERQDGSWRSDRVSRKEPAV